jgi:hypothetical protein
MSWSVVWPVAVAVIFIVLTVVIIVLNRQR